MHCDLKNSRKPNPWLPGCSCCRWPVGKALGSAWRDGAGGGIKAWPSQGVFSSITPLPGLLAFIVFAFSDLVKKGNTLRAVPSNKLLERTYHCPWEAVLTTSMGTLAFVMTWEAACPLCPRLVLEEPRLGLEGKTRVLALDKMEWPPPADACLLYPALSVYYPATWIIQPSLCWTVFPASGVLAGLYVEQELWLVLSPECLQTLFKWLDTAGKVPWTPQHDHQAPWAWLLWALLKVKWSGRRTSDASHPHPFLVSHKVVTLTTATYKDRPAVKTQLNACLYAVESGSLSRMLFLFLNMNGFANQLILVYKWLTRHFFFFFLSFFPPSLLSFCFFLLFSLSLPLQRNIFTSVAFTAELYIKIMQWGHNVTNMQAHPQFWVKCSEMGR